MGPTQLCVVLAFLGPNPHCVLLSPEPFSESLCLHPLWASPPLCVPTPQDLSGPQSHCVLAQWVPCSLCPRSPRAPHTARTQLQPPLGGVRSQWRPSTSSHALSLLAIARWMPQTPARSSLLPDRQPVAFGGKHQLWPGTCEPEAQRLVSKAPELHTTVTLTSNL